ncbi:hypothetical protein DFH09DRAFT_1376985 [Mycena vulgaris]|nr:hypothetical protein DFH09DRAFT_1376985 [Mycena vulgaris]
MPLSVALAATRLDERRSIQRYISPPCIPPASLNDAVSAANADTLGLRLGLPGLDIYKFHPHRLLGAARVSDARSSRSGHSNPAPQRQLAGPPCILHTTSASSRRPPSPYPPHNIVPPALLTMFLHSSRSSELRSSGSHKQRNATCATLVVCVLQVVWGYAPRATLGKGSFPLRGSGPACTKAGRQPCSGRACICLESSACFLLSPASIRADIRAYAPPFSSVRAHISTVLVLFASAAVFYSRRAHCDDEEPVAHVGPDVCDAHLPPASLRADLAPTHRRHVRMRPHWFHGALPSTMRSLIVRGAAPHRGCPHRARRRAASLRIESTFHLACARLSFCYFLLPLFFVPSLAAPSAPVPEDLSQSSRTESMHGFITYLLAEWGAARDALIVERRIFVE